MKVSKWQKRYAEPRSPAFARVIRNLAIEVTEPVEMTLCDIETKGLLRVHMTMEEARRLSAELASAADEASAETMRKQNKRMHIVE